MTGPVRPEGETPGESEMSWGEGIMPDPNREPPHPYHTKIAASETNRHSDEEDYMEGYSRWTGEG